MIAIVSLGSISFVGGIVAGKEHAMHLARNGGEGKYPRKVQEAVQAYRMTTNTY